MRQAARKRNEIPAIDAQVSRAEMPVRLSNQVKTMPAPHIEVRKVKNETTRDALGAVVSALSNTHDMSCRAGYSHKCRDGHAA